MASIVSTKYLNDFTVILNKPTDRSFETSPRKGKEYRSVFEL